MDHDCHDNAMIIYDNTMIFKSICIIKLHEIWTSLLCTLLAVLSWAFCILRWHSYPEMVETFHYTPFAEVGESAQPLPDLKKLLNTEEFSCETSSAGLRLIFSLEKTSLALTRFFSFEKPSNFTE